MPQPAIRVRIHQLAGGSRTKLIVVPANGHAVVVDDEPQKLNLDVVGEIEVMGTYRFTNGIVGAEPAKG